jgi:hypothetical protein
MADSTRCRPRGGVRSQQPRSVRIYPGLDHDLGSPIDLPAGVLPQDLAVADIDSDGRRDLVVVNGSRISLRRALPGGGFASPTVYATATGRASA